MSPSSHDLLIDIQGLKTHFPLDEGSVKAVDGVDMQIYRNRTLCVVGETRNAPPLASILKGKLCHPYNTPKSS